MRRHVRRRTFRDAYAKIAEPMDVSKPAECRNYSLRCTLCSGFSVHPFSFSPFSLGPTLSSVHAHFLAPSISSGSISLGSLDLLYLAYPAATIPHLYALISVHTDNGYLRENISRISFTLHNADDLCFFLCASHVPHIISRGHFFIKLIIYKLCQGQCKYI